MWGDMLLWNVQGPLLPSGDTLVQFILTVDYTIKPLEEDEKMIGEKFS